jgi:hypothetical protein
MKRDDLPPFADLRNGGNMPRYPEGGFVIVLAFVMALVWAVVFAWGLSWLL